MGAQDYVIKKQEVIKHDKIKYHKDIVIDNATSKHAYNKDFVHVNRELPNTSQYFSKVYPK
jgi:hypothetical protein